MNKFMRHLSLTFGGRMRASIISSCFAVLLATGSLTAPALAADQPSTTAQVQDTIGPHTRQIHGVVKGYTCRGCHELHHNDGTLR